MGWELWSRCMWHRTDPHSAVSTVSVWSAGGYDYVREVEFCATDDTLTMRIWRRRHDK